MFALSLQAIGAAAQLGGVTRMTLSITVLVMEGTGALQLVVPMMLAVFMAKIVGDAVGMGVYDLHIKIRGAPVLVSLYWQAALLLCWRVVVSLWTYLQELCMWSALSLSCACTGLVMASLHSKLSALISSVCTSVCMWYILQCRACTKTACITRDSYTCQKLVS